VENISNEHFFKKLINGNFGLAKTYWIFNFGEYIVLKLSIEFFKSASFVIITILTIHFIYRPIILIGVYRAANKYTGRQIWAILAKISVYLGWVGYILAVAATLVTLHDLIK